MSELNLNAKNHLIKAVINYFHEVIIVMDIKIKKNVYLALMYNALLKIKSLLMMQIKILSDLFDGLMV